jgi:hypothetical protein
MKTSRPAIDLTCLHCGKPNDASTSTGQGELPGDGDISLCIDCGAIAFFDFQAGNLRAPNEVEMVALLKDPNVQRALLALKRLPKVR